MPEAAPRKPKDGIEKFCDEYLYALSFCSSRSKGKFEKVTYRSIMGVSGTTYSFLPFA